MSYCQIYLMCKEMACCVRRKPVRVGFGAVLPLILISAAQAQSAMQAYQISAGSLNQALNLFAVKAGVVVYFDANLTRDKQTDGLSGTYSVDNGLQKILSGSGLVAILNRDGSYQVEVVRETGPISLSAINVGASSFGLGRTTEYSESYTTEEMSTATRLGLSIRDTPQSVSVIPRQLMNDMQLESVTDVVNTSVGITSKAQDSERNNFSARGYDIDNLQVDGIATTWSSGYSAGETSTDTIIYDRVEIVRGATGLITGAGNPSAAINLVRKKADSDEFLGQASITAGSWDRYQGSVDISSPINEDGTVRGRLVGNYQDRHSFVDAAENKKTVLYGTVAADLTDNTLLNIGVSYQKNNPRGSVWGGLPVWFSDGTKTNWSRSKTTAPDWAKWGSDNTTYFANVEHAFDSGAKVYANYKKSILNADLRLSYPLTLPDVNTGEGMDPLLGWYDYHKEQDTIDLYTSIPVNVFGKDHEVVAGVVHSKQDFTSYNRTAISSAPYGNFYDWNPAAYEKPEWGEKTLDRQEETKQTGAYAVARLTLADPLTFTIGSRFTNWDTYIQTNNASAVHIKHHQILTPYAGLVYDINDVYSVYASYSDIFNPQNRRDVSGNYLDPIDGKNYEVGIKAEYFQGDLNASLALYHIEQDNLAQADGNNLVSGSADQAYKAAEGATSNGFEVELSGAITDHWNIMAGWSQFQAEDADGVDVNTRFPRRTATLFTTYQINEWTIGGGLNWESDTYNLETNPSGQIEKLKQGSFTLVRLMGKYQVTRDLSAQLNINNLFDKKYYTNNRQLAYGAPRNVNLTFKYDF
jgi:outer membrane receptor for ferric coprogen and ferric-rhodotorulic acid